MFEVSGTQITSLLTNEPAAFAGFVDRGGEGWAAVVNSWNGMATDTRANSERMFLAASGGHAASSNNGAYAFDVRRMRWTVVKAPTPASVLPSSYVNLSSYTANPEAYAAYLANPTGGSFYDELPDGSPTSRHTYETLVFAPDLGSQGSLLFGCRRQWWLNIATGVWTKRGMAGAADPSTTDRGQDGQGYWDEVTRRYVLSSSQDNSDVRYWYHPESDTFGLTGAAFHAGGYTLVYSSSEKVGRTLWTLLYDYDNGRHGLPWRMVEWSLDNVGVGINHNITLGASFDGKTSSTDGWSDSGVTFVAPLGKFLITVTTAQDGERFAWLDASTWVCELASFPGIGAGLTGTAGGFCRTENRFKYFPSLGAFGWIPARLSNEAGAIMPVRFCKVV
jgi:hypothetical protein